MKRVKFVSVILCATIFTALSSAALSGCSKGGGESKGKYFDPPITLTTDRWLTGDQSEEDWDNLPYQTWCREKLGIIWKPAFVAADTQSHNDTLLMLAASQDLPDVLADAGDLLPQFYQSGNLRVVQDDIQQWGSDLVKYLWLEEFPARMGATAFGNNLTEDGKFYAIPHVLDPLESGTYEKLFIRADIVQDLGFENPTTIEELEKIMAAYKAKNPSQYPYRAEKSFYGTSSQVFSAFGVSPGWIYDVDGSGNYVYGSTQSGMKQALAKFRDWYKKGYISPGFDNFEVREAGLYRIDMRVGNWFNQDLPVNRKIEIDGKVPFREFLNYSFSYDNDWTYHTVHTDKGDPYLFYFEPGTHTIAMTVVLGKYADIIMSLYEDTDALTDLLLDITLITGNNPDVNYEYNLERNIKDIKPRLKSIIDSIDEKVAVLRELSGGKEVASINSLLQARQDLQEYYEDPEIIPKKLSDMSNMQDNFTTWYASFQSQPLIIDYFVVNTPDAPARKVTSNFWKKLVATCRNFMTSFVKDYDSIGKLSDTDGKTILDVWVSMGTESADILKNLSDSGFTPDSNIAVNISILPAGQMNAGAVNSLQLAIISGKAPDVALGVGAGTPVELGIRGAVADMSKMEGFEDVKKNYVAECFNANTFNDGVYGIPERMDFRVLIYRTDIFQTLGLSVPDTWDDVIDKTLPALAQNQMEMFIPQDYTMFLFQNNGEYYSEDGLSTMLDTPEAYQAFKQYVEMYTDYGIPVTTQFFNRFRVGTIPIGVGNINEYFSLLYGAPEILGKWQIALLPGVKRADGSVKRSFGSTVTSSSVILSGDKEEASWEFMKWWTSVETQSRFAQSVEARINVASRVNTANKEAFKSLPWITKDLKVIVASWDHIKEAKGVLGGYYVARHLNNAWARLVVEKQSISVRDSLEQAIDGVTKEMQSYQSEYPNLVRAAGE